MTTIQQPLSRARSAITVERVTNKLNRVHFGLEARSVIVFWEGVPIAVDTGGSVYFHTPINSAAISRVINEWNPDAPHIRTAPGDFDFVVGQVLTQTGLPLTRRDA